MDVRINGNRRELEDKVAELADLVRGYEGIKEANIARFRERAQHLLSSPPPAEPGKNGN